MSIKGFRLRGKSKEEKVINPLNKPELLPRPKVLTIVITLLCQNWKDYA